MKGRVGTLVSSLRLLLTELDRFPRAANRKQRGAAGEAEGWKNAVHIQPPKRPLACAAER